MNTLDALKAVLVAKGYAPLADSIAALFEPLVPASDLRVLSPNAHALAMQLIEECNAACDHSTAIAIRQLYAAGKKQETPSFARLTGEFDSFIAKLTKAKEAVSKDHHPLVERLKLALADNCAITASAAFLNILFVAPWKIKNGNATLEIVFDDGSELTWFPDGSVVFYSGKGGSDTLTSWLRWAVSLDKLQRCVWERLNSPPPTFSPYSYNRDKLIEILEKIPLTR